MSAYDDSIIFEIIYGFHMPLFMFISGFLSYKTKGDTNLDWLKRRFVSLVIPFIVWTIIIYFVRYVLMGSDITFKEYILYVFYAPDYSVWFIWVLFLADTVLLLTNGVIEKFFNLGNGEVLKRASTYAFVNIFVIGLSRVTCIMGIGLLKWYISFFLLGNLYNCCINKLDINSWRVKKWVKVSIIIISVGLLSFWKRTDFPRFVGAIIPNDLDYIGIICVIYNYIVAIGGIVSSILVVKYVSTIHNRIPDLISKVGGYTAEIYLVSVGLQTARCYSGVLYVDIFLSISISIFIPIVTSRFLKGTVLRALLFGK